MMSLKIINNLKIYFFVGCIFLLLFSNVGSSIFIKTYNEDDPISEEPFKGYTLFGPMWDTNTYLINNNGKVVYTWKSQYPDSQAAYLLENGNLVRTSLAQSPIFSGGVQGRIEMFNSNGDKIWNFLYASDQYTQHHDVEILQNGNILMIAWEVKTREEAIAAGKNPDQLHGNQFWPDHIIEVEPIFPEGGNIVWEWHVWDHLIQDYDPTKDNYGIVNDHPELIDINFAGNRADWNHINSVDYNEELDQILLSCLMFDEIWIIDHSTTTEEAVGHSGGNSGKGGDLLYRWGNPSAYDHGTTNDRKFYNQHCAQWIEEGCPGEGNIMVFNNGPHPDGRYSSVDEIVPPADENGSYEYIPGNAYGPEDQLWIYTKPNPNEMYSQICSSAQRLPNGNTLICSATQAMFLEINNNKEIVWEYDNPYPLLGQKTVTETIRYPPDYPGIPKNKNINQRWIIFNETIERIFSRVGIILQR